MKYQIIEDFTQMKPGDILEFRCPRFGLVTQWLVDGIHLGALHVESHIALRSLSKQTAPGADIMMVPEQMTRAMTIIRPNERI